MENKTGNIVIAQDVFVKIVDTMVRKRAVKIVQELAEETKTTIIFDLKDNIAALVRSGKISSVNDVLGYLDSLTGI